MVVGGVGGGGGRRVGARRWRCHGIVALTLRPSWRVSRRRGRRRRRRLVRPPLWRRCSPRRGRRGRRSLGGRRCRRARRGRRLRRRRRRDPVLGAEPLVAAHAAFPVPRGLRRERSAGREHLVCLLEADVGGVGAAQPLGARTIRVGAGRLRWGRGWRWRCGRRDVRRPPIARARPLAGRDAGGVDGQRPAHGEMFPSSLVVAPVHRVDAAGDGKACLVAEGAEPRPSGRVRVARWQRRRRVRSLAALLAIALQALGLLAGPLVTPRLARRLHSRRAVVLVARHGAGCAASNAAG